jgi:hypothetical protein
MLINTSQQIERWGLYFPETTNNDYLGLLVNMYNIGCIVGFFIT